MLHQPTRNTQKYIYIYFQIPKADNGFTPLQTCNVAIILPNVSEGTRKAKHIVCVNPVNSVHFGTSYMLAPL